MAVTNYKTDQVGHSQLEAKLNELFEDQWIVEHIFHTPQAAAGISWMIVSRKYEEDPEHSHG